MSRMTAVSLSFLCVAFYVVEGASLTRPVGHPEKSVALQNLERQQPKGGYAGYGGYGGYDSYGDLNPISTTFPPPTSPEPAISKLRPEVSGAVSQTVEVNDLEVNSVLYGAHGQ